MEAGASPFAPPACRVTPGRPRPLLGFSSPPGRGQAGAECCAPLPQALALWPSAARAGKRGDAAFPSPGAEKPGLGLGLPPRGSGDNKPSHPGRRRAGCATSARCLQTRLWPQDSELWAALISPLGPGAPSLGVGVGGGQGPFLFQGQPGG